MNKRIAIFGFSFLAAAALLFSCRNPVGASSAAGQSGSVTVKLGISSSARTVVPNMLSAADTYTVTLHSADGFPDHSASAGSGTVSLTGVECGTWSVSARALKGGIVLAAGTLSGQALSPGGSLSVQVPLSPSLTDSSGTGDVSFEIRLPAAVDSVDFALENLSTGTTATSSISAATLPDTYWGVVYAGTGLAAGNYSLAMRLKSGATSLGVFRETIAVWGGCTSDKWVAADGSLADYREFTASDIGSADAALSGLLVWDALGSGLFSFSSSTYAYGPLTVAKGETVSFMPTSSIAGQTIQYAWNGSAPRSIASGAVSGNLSLASGTNTLVVSVAPSSGSAVKTYTFTISYLPYYTSGSATAMQMVKVPAGNYLRSDSSGYSLVDAFYLGKYEVTQAQYTAVMGATAYANPAAANPAESINWYSMLVFCNKLSALEGLSPVYTIGGSKDTAAWGAVPASDDATWNAAAADWTANGYRLPTEAEWQWAAMNGTTWPTYTYAGSNTIGDVAWYSGNAASSQAAGGKAPNAIGIYDLSGNVWEACWDWDAAYPAGALTNPTGAASGTAKIRRGGAWSETAANCEKIYRNEGTSMAAANNVHGFRVARNGAPRYPVVYNANGAASGSVPASGLITQGGSFAGAMNSGSLAKTNYDFAGWNTQADGSGTDYSANTGTVCPSAGMTLYAQWNLLKNPGWESGYPGAWTVSGAWGWNQLPSRSGVNGVITSNSTATHSQVVNLIAAGYNQTDLESTSAQFTYSEYIETRGDQGGKVQLTIEVLDSDGLTIGSATTGLFTIVAGVPYTKYSVSYTNTPGASIQKVRVISTGRDLSGWGGYYGPRFDDASLTVLAP